MTTLKALLIGATAELSTASATPRLDAEVLLAHALGKPRSYLYTWPERELTPAEQAAFQALQARRRQGEPVAYLTGEREFWSFALAVTPAVLIPRPDTEVLVEQALARLPLAQPVSVADLGTGSGAIALAIACERPAAHIVATDASAAALALAQDNARRLQLNNVQFRHGDWLAALPDERFALIVSNPPYLAARDPHRNQGDLRFEPPQALVSGEDGLDAIRQIVADAAAHLLPGGGLLLEHGFAQGEAVRALLRAHGFREVITYRDASGHERVSGGLSN